VSTLAARGLRFTARLAGPEDGRPVILLHGFPQTSACWERQLATLAGAGFRAVAYDQRGYSPGARPAGVESYTNAEFAADCLAIADGFGWERFDLVGHDLGGAIAWTVAGFHPERLRSLTAVSTAHPAAFKAAYSSASSGDQHRRSGYIRNFKEAPRGEPEAALLADGAAGLRAVYAGLPDEHVEEYVRILAEPGALASCVDWYRASRGSVSAATPATPVPTLYAWGDQDPSIGRAAADATAGFVAGPYRFEVFEGSGHWLPELDGDRLDALLLEHLGST
jgi:pimeloyl-ACP methyl ester carboxylesterase